MIAFNHELISHQNAGNGQLVHAELDPRHARDRPGGGGNLEIFIDFQGRCSRVVIVTEKALIIIDDP